MSSTATASPRRWGRTLGAVALLCASLSGCAAGRSDVPDPPRPAAAAQAYFDAYHEAMAAGFTNGAQFYTPDALMDYRALFNWSTGRGYWAQHFRDTHGGIASWGERDIADTVAYEPFEPVYVSLDGALDPVIQQLFYPYWRTANVFSVSDAGISAEVLVTSVNMAGDPLRQSAQAVAEEYVQAWGRHDTATAHGLYAAGAELRDTLLGVRLTGTDQILDAVAEDTGRGALNGLTLRTIRIPSPGPSDALQLPAVFLAAPTQTSRVVDRVVILIDVGAPRECREAMGVALWLDESRLVTREERFHRVDSVDQCWEALPEGAWWERARTPEPVRFRRTGTIEIAGLPCAIWNGTGPRAGLLGDALARFPAGGLPPPDLTSVTFAPPDPDPWTTYGFVKGAPDTVLPSTWDGCPAQGCPDGWPAQARLWALTDLARVWLADVDRRAESMARFAESHGLGWTHRRAVESIPALDRAAATVAWGLADESLTAPEPLEGMTCDALRSEYTDLTGAAPMRPCPGS